MIEQQTSVGNRYLLIFAQVGRFSTETENEESAAITGQIELIVEAVEAGQIRLRLTALSLTSPGSRLAGEDLQTGVVTIQTRQGTGHLVLKQESWMLTVGFSASFSYGYAARELGYEQFENHLFLAPAELFAGILTGVVETVDDEDAPFDLMLVEGELRLSFEDGALGRIRQLRIPIREMPLYSAAMLPTEGLGSPGAFLAFTAPPCPPGTTVKQRILRIQPVGFKSNDTDTNPTGPASGSAFSVLADNMVTAAQAIWDKACISLEVLPTIHIVDNALKTNGLHANVIASGPTVTSPTTTVYFVDHPLTDVGGGCCYDAGLATPKIVVSNRNLGTPNLNLLAHELGHALGACHPTLGISCLSTVSDLFQYNAMVLWVPDAKTVMEPGSPNPDHNTHRNFINALVSPALVALPTTPGELATISDRCPTYDTPDHFIRDFPEHTGDDAPTLPSGRTFYSTSNIWNRWENDPDGGIAPSTPAGTPPPHQQPFRFDPDGTAHTNYLFAKVEVRQDLPSHGVQVKFYIYHPGSGGSTAPFVHLGDADVPDTLAFGSPEIVSHGWTVPTGTPQHSCVFAVVRSASEPHQSINAASPNAWTLVRTENDWAQRNLNIIDVMPQMGGMSLRMAPIMLIAPPELEVEPVFQIQIDARQARDLQNLQLNLLDSDSRQMSIQPGSITTIELSAMADKTPLLALNLEVTLPDTVTIGENYSVQINPRIGEHEFVGYGYQLNVTEPQMFVQQTLDIALGAFQDIAQITSLESADVLASLHRDLVQARFSSPIRLAGQLRENASYFNSFVDELNDSPIELADFGLGSEIMQFLKTLEAGEYLELLLSYSDLVSRLQMVAYVYQPPILTMGTNVSAGLAPLRVEFESEAGGFDLSEPMWDFGDGSTSTEKNPVHTYVDPGTYTASVTVSARGGKRRAQIAVTVF